MAASHTVTKVLRRFSSFRYKLVLEGVGVGAVAGGVAVLFRLAVAQSERFLLFLSGRAAEQPLLIPVWFGVLLLAAGAVTALLRWEPMITGSGIPQLDGEMEGYFDQCWWRVLIAKFVGGVLSIGAGLSLGREGPSVQLGAMAGKGVARLTGRMRTEEKLLVTCGASAGLSAAFNAPLAGALFALEEVHKNFSVEVLLSSLASSITANFVTRNVFGIEPVFNFSEAVPIPLAHFPVVLFLGVCIGVFGVCYNFCTGKVQKLYDKIQNRFLRTVIPFLLAGTALFLCPDITGGGSALVMKAAGGLSLGMAALLLVLKFCFSLLSFGSGVPGGIFLPLLVLGALCGGTFHGLAEGAGLSLDLQALVVLGMAAAFAAIIRAPITGTLLITEMTGNFDHLLFIALISLVAYSVADLLRGRPIYAQLLERMLQKQGLRQREDRGEKVLLESEVRMGAPACGRPLSQLYLPAHCLVIAVRRGEEEIVPRGDTVLRAGDGLVVLTDEAGAPDITRSLEEYCRRMAVERNGPGEPGRPDGESESAQPSDAPEER